MMLFALSIALYIAALVSAFLFGSYTAIGAYSSVDIIIRKKIDYYTSRYLVQAIGLFVAGAVAGWFA